MDLSLVLISQGIETTIERPELENEWGLVVAAENYERAREAIRLYALENQHWRWQPTALAPGLFFDWASLVWVLLAGFFYWYGTRIDLRSLGIMDGVAVTHGQWWRLFTAVWLHG